MREHLVVSILINLSEVYRELVEQNNLVSVPSTLTPENSENIEIPTLPNGASVLLNNIVNVYNEYLRKMEKV